MRTKILFPIAVFIGLGSIVVLGNSPDFVSNFIESVKNNSFTRMFSAESNNKPNKDVLSEYDNQVQKRDEPQKTTNNGAISTDIPDYILWRVMFSLPGQLEKSAQEARNAGKSDALWTNYFTRQAKLSDENARLLKDISSQHDAEIRQIDEKIKTFIEEIRQRKSSETFAPEDFVDLQRQKDAVTLRYRDDLKTQIGEDAFAEFSDFVNGEFAKGFVVNTDSSPNLAKSDTDIPTNKTGSGENGLNPFDETPERNIVLNKGDGSYGCGGSSILIFGYSVIVYDDNPPQRVSGVVGTELYILGFPDFFCEDWDPWIHSALYRSDDPENVYGEGTLTGFRDIVPAAGYFYTFYADSGYTYCVSSDHRYYYYENLDYPYSEWWVRYLIRVGDTQVCHTFTVPPTPTPTPPCDPGKEELVPCEPPTPTPTPSPLPSPSATITPIEVVEKNGTANIKVTVLNNDGGTTKFIINNPTVGGRATFADDSTEMVVPNSVTNQPLTIKGVTESTQIDNIGIVARLNGATGNAAEDKFTVATITSLTFQRVDSSYIDLTDNPGTDGMHTSEEGQRIYPDKIDVADVNASPTVDRQLVKVNATILPAAANLKVYFGSFDLDDPSATGGPIDTTNADGNDNNGAVNGSKSGDFVATGGSPCSNGAAGTNPTYVSKIECTSASDGTVTAIFKTTMQPGDNFAIGASVDKDYRDGITVNASDGSNLRNAATQTISVSGQANPNNVPGIRTNMLTVWRKLHIEVDSMGAVTGNKVEGTMVGSGKIKQGTRTVTVNPTSSMDEDRFENGRMVIDGTSCPVIDAVPASGSTPAIHSNTTTTVTIVVPSRGVDITPTTPFILYDDDDMNDSETPTTLHGDDSEDVSEPNIDLVQSDETACVAGTDGKVTGSCNGLLSAYTIPAYDLVDSHTVIPFSSNLTVTDISAINNNSAYFHNFPTHDRSDFWTIYMVGAYQFTELSDNDPGGNITWGRADGFQGAIGLFTFNELNRPTENDILDQRTLPPGIDVWRNRPVGAKYNTLHELGHLFDGQHEDCAAYGGNAGIMRQFGNITSGVFCTETISKIRGGTGVVNP